MASQLVSGLGLPRLLPPRASRRPPAGRGSEFRNGGSRPGGSAHRYSECGASFVSAAFLGLRWRSNETGLKQGRRATYIRTVVSSPCSVPRPVTQPEMRSNKEARADCNLHKLESASWLWVALLPSKLQMYSPSEQ